MKTPLPFCLALTLVSLSAGCASSPTSRIEKHQAEFNTYPADVQTALRKGEVKIGFTPEQVTIALGAPDRVVTRTSEQGKGEVWIYREQSSRFGLGLGIGAGSGSVGGGVGVSTGGAEFPDERMRVVFTAGRVSAVEQSNG